MSVSAVSDLIFSSDQANHNFARVLGDLRRARHSISHRLRSISRDAAFVPAVAARYPGLFLVANERCGSWYVPAGQAAASAYFKSTDGHTGQWSVSTRRLNLHLLGLSSLSSSISSPSSCSFILVDSTRRGKRMPDALSKTVPLWCCAVNRLVFGQPDAPLYTPPGVVSPSEHSQMLACLPAQTEALRRVGVLHDGPAWTARLNGRPLRPVWVTPDMPWPDIDALVATFTVVVCCTASRIPDGAVVDQDHDHDHTNYVQGAADDTENWAYGLTAKLFWNHRDELLATPEADLPARIEALVAAARQKEQPDAVTDGQTPITPITPFLSVGTPSLPTLYPACEIVFVRQVTAPSSWVRSPVRLEVGLGKQDKTASRNLRHALPQICAFVSAYLNRTDSHAHVGVACDSGRDLSVGTALALLCACFDADGQPGRPDTRPAVFTKDAIRLRLGRIMTAMPQANPSRTTLQSVNSFLMG
ncbi:tRNA a64-2 -o-ribosylphosphate transferase [Grosmannia clavigera kw1407]|uniref:tRNA a64-2-o-ribosylphosphate transferase n=1 Tax=Grosmannia clavigera (strain kw1407 / UAMH 11150) TaxID=655863 RepID=F0XM43_GROCL|nr:tRNA a64-2 -o-ribosylphosphate transferase [Grosmannia clavigera kw1407]EFX01017.1 tRNA a64-2 -o-ribosylphosphate transferase [Grosmannia clavigera kw1407]